MKQLTASSMAAAWTASMKNSLTKQKYINGINATQGNPMAAAAAAVDLWAQRVADSKAKFVAKLANKSVDAWKGPSVAKADRLATGADTGAAKYQAGVQPYLAVYQQMHDAVQGMPKGTIQAAKDRSNKALEIIMQAAGRS